MVFKMRRPAVSGSFYPSDPQELKNLIEQCFLNTEFGPGQLPRRDHERVIGAIVPHAGYIYSGPVAAHAYKSIASSGGAETYVIIGTNHTGYGIPISLSPDDWEMPFGVIRLDKELAKEIIKSSGVADFDKYAHYAEHSVEVQLPFIQYIHDVLGLEPPKIVPIVLSIHTDIKILKDLARGILEASEKLSRKVIVIGSSDLNHVGRFYGLYSRDKSSDAFGEFLDKIALERILEFDSEGLIRVATEHSMTICGIGAIVTTLEYSKMKDSQTVELLKYANSSQISGEKDLCVGYAAIVTR
ncbi:MAG: AmmeMemoRadiSam system protein B [Thermoplasmata archaeon]|nr:MAG: AmmeMemoRadiSam system protein B [Thermoplasmata archaeon]